MIGLLYVISVQMGAELAPIVQVCCYLQLCGGGA